MPRQVRIEFPGAIYHIMCRGDRREEVFRDGGDREMMLATLAETVAKTGWQAHAWVLMISIWGPAGDPRAVAAALFGLLGVL